MLLFLILLLHLPLVFYIAPTLAFAAGFAFAVDFALAAGLVFAVAFALANY